MRHSVLIDLIDIIDLIDNSILNIKNRICSTGSFVFSTVLSKTATGRPCRSNPPILVFDEATSSLDSQTEIEIMSSIKKLKGEKTILIIAHRLSTLDYCDKIYELKDGKLYSK